MKNILFSLFFLLFFLSSEAQNQEWVSGFSFGLGRSIFSSKETYNVRKIKPIYYLAAGLHFQKRLSTRWAIQVHPSLSMSGNHSIIDQPEYFYGVEKMSSISKFIHLAVHPKFYITKGFYASLGPDVSYLNSNTAYIYQEDVDEPRKINATHLFNRVNVSASASIGYSMKIEESRKNAPLRIAALWFVEVRLRQGLTDILSNTYFEKDNTQYPFAIELMTGISFASLR